MPRTGGGRSIISSQPYLYFISYAHDNAHEDVLVGTFHQDLTGALRPLVDPDQPIGFCDPDLRVGERWWAGLIAPLSTCRVFVALCGPRYVDSEACAKEWNLFAHRIARARLATAATPLIPLIWEPTADLPEAISSYQFHEPAFGATYRAHGLRGLLAEPRFAPDYAAFIAALAQRVRALSELPVPPDKRRPAFGDVPGTFVRRDDPPPSTFMDGMTSSLPRLNPNDRWRRSP
jgi:hypothetical protein